MSFIWYEENNIKTLKEIKKLQEVSLEKTYLSDKLRI